MKERLLKYLAHNRLHRQFFPLSISSTFLIWIFVSFFFPFSFSPVFVSIFPISVFISVPTSTSPPLATSTTASTIWSIPMFLLSIFSIPWSVSLSVSWSTSASWSSFSESQISYIIHSHLNTIYSPVQSSQKHLKRQSRLQQTTFINIFQRIHIKNQALFFSKDKSKKLKCRLLQFLFGALRVNKVVRNASVEYSSLRSTAYTIKCMLIFSADTWEELFIGKNGCFCV